MKSAYELAMERLNKAAPSIKLTEKQKQELAELDLRYTAKIAEREIALKDQTAKLLAAGDVEKAAETQRQLAADRKNLQAELEDKKKHIRKW